MTLPPSTMITSMTVAQANLAVHQALLKFWENGGMPHESLDCLVKAAEIATEALARCTQEDDLELAEGPLDVITGCLRGRFITDQSARDDAAVEIYEGLIDAGCLPGINAQRHTSDALTS